jgi:hypothetical protein
MHFPRIELLSRVVILASLAAPASIHAQSREINPETTVRVTIGKSSVQPEATAMVPVYLAPAEKHPAGTVSLQVSYISANVSFDRVEAGPAADAAGARLHADVARSKNEDGVPVETVTITASSNAAGGIPTGLLAYLTLRASAQARPAKITLHSNASATPPTSSQALPDVQSFDGEVEVVAPNTGPTVVCFFFTH